MKLRTQIFLLLLVISAALLGALDMMLPGRLLPYLTDQFASELKQEALLVRDTLETSVHSDAEMHDYAGRIGATLGRRITIIDSGGKVIGDNAADSALMENHNSRPEVQEARSRGFGQAVRYSRTLDMEMLYVAVPFRTPRAETGVVRLSLPYQVIGQARTEVRRTAYWLSLIAFLVAAMIAYLASYRISRSAETMAMTAKQVTRGQLEARAPVKGPLELQVLSRAFNQMTDQLVSLIRENAAERQRLRTILEGMQEGVLMVDPEGRVDFINDTGYRMLDLQHPAEGQRMIEIVRQLELEKAMKAAVSTKEAQRLEVELYRSKRNVLISLNPVLDRDRVRDLVVVLQDVTELRKLENVRKEFVANVSHELRTPLTSIQGYAETLLGEPNLETRTRQEFVSVIHKHARQLSGLIDDLLRLSSLESERPGVEQTIVNVGETARSVAQAMSRTLESKNLRCSVKADPDTDVPANQRALEQVFYNLLDNAVKYTPEGGSIVVEVVPDGSNVRGSVQDTGIGIPAENLSRIFERFYRVDKSRSREMGGTGLGLAIVKHILQMHGGSIRVESRIGEGSRFTFYLPREPRAGEPESGGEGEGESGRAGERGREGWREGGRDGRTDVSGCTAGEGTRGGPG